MTATPSLFLSTKGESEIQEAYQAILDQWPVAHSVLQVETSYGRTHVIASGDVSKPPAILLHAFFATAMAWYKVAGEVSARYRVYAVDVLGEANRSVPTKPIKSLEESLTWFTELLSGLGVQRFHLVGNSFGGFLSAWYASNLGSSVLTLSLIGPASTFRGMLPFFVHMFIPKMLYLLMPWLPFQRTSVRHGIKWAMAKQPSDADFEHLFETVMLHGNAINQIFPRVYSAEELARITAPTQLILGDHERIYNPESAAEHAKRLMPDKQVHFVANAHHVTAISQPEAVAMLLLTTWDTHQR
jgi:pimeloyl-ACP methyl ester carboxylesterase